MGSCKLILFLYSWRHHQLNLCLSSLVFIFSFEKITASPVCSTASLPQLLKVFPGTYRESFLLLLTALHRLFISSLPWPFMCLNPVLPFFFCGSCCLDLWSFSSFFLHSLSTFFFFFVVQCFKLSTAFQMNEVQIFTYLLNFYAFQESIWFFLLQLKTSIHT